MSPQHRYHRGRPPALRPASQRLIAEPEFQAAATHIRTEIDAMPTAAEVASDLLPASTGKGQLAVAT